MTSAPTDIRRRGARFAFAMSRCAWLATLCLISTSPVTGAISDSDAESPARIEAAAHTYVESLIPPGSSGTRITVLPIDRRLRLARCAVPLSAQLPAGSNLAARATVHVSCDGPAHWSLYVPVTVESQISVLVLRHAVARDAHLSAEDVTVENLRVAGTAMAYLTSAQELASRTVRRPLPIGTALTVEMFVATTVVHRGQEVTLVAGGADLEIRAAGRALADAPAGARIQVQNLSSSLIVEGVVESADVVRVAL